MIGKIEKRFSNANSNIIHALNPSSPMILRKEAVLLLAEAYESNIEDLSIESKRTKTLDLDKFVKHFAEQHGNRQIQLLQQCEVMLTCVPTQSCSNDDRHFNFLYFYVLISPLIKPQAMGKEKCKM